MPRTDPNRRYGPDLKRKGAMPPTAVSSIDPQLIFKHRATALEISVMVHLPGKRKATVVAVASTIAIIAAIASETFVVATKKTITIGLLVLIAVAIVSAGVAAAVPVEMRSLRIVILSALCVACASVLPVLVALA